MRGRPPVHSLTQIVQNPLAPTDLLDLPPFTADRLRYLLQTNEEDVEGKAALNFLATYGLICNSTLCPRHNVGMYLSMDSVRKAEKFMWRCRSCRQEGSSGRTSIKKGSIFENSTFPLQKLLTLFFHWAANHNSNHQTILREVGISKQASIDWYNFLRDVCQEWVFRHQAQNKLGGPGTEVEVDESPFYREKYSRGVRRRHVWVISMVQKDTKEVRLLPFDQTGSPSDLIPIILDNVRPGTTIITDGQRASGILSNLGTYQDQWAEHGLKFGDPDDSTLKDDMRRIAGTAIAVFPTYLYQWIYRHTHPTRLFENILITIAELFPTNCDNGMTPPCWSHHPECSSGLHIKDVFCCIDAYFKKQAPYCSA
ncbi:hypothetical protein QR680_010571 [Steinernema hermaphroditum]|uniref:ISXO2-like transposase domain-containing protein n=1 Tax=Steinernema hermaphroditum TaxID=289476 RepID=A0AA39IS45_9BILA|nr:hypothetical protein QR680_010571 [Steinernema hermaphroditum]